MHMIYVVYFVLGVSYVLLCVVCVVVCVMCGVLCFCMGGMLWWICVWGCGGYICVV